MGCRYCLNVVIDTWKVYNGMQYSLNVVIDTWKVYNGMQVLPECCHRMESLQWDAGTA